MNTTILNGVICFFLEFFYPRSSLEFSLAKQIVSVGSFDSNSDYKWKQNHIFSQKQTLCTGVSSYL